LAPWADALYACDLKWWNKYHSEVVGNFKGEKWSCDRRVAHPGVCKIEGVAEPGLSLDETIIHQGGNSGYQAINLAFHWGAAKIVLLGFDCQIVDGKAHWFGQHPHGLVQNQPFNQWKLRFNALAEDLEAQGVDVVNCSENTALTCFKIERIENV
jgi:hypothetical protein